MTCCLRAVVQLDIVLPLNDEALTAQLGLRAKRGVLLYGPPGSDKTTIGRALLSSFRFPKWNTAFPAWHCAPSQRLVHSFRGPDRHALGLPGVKNG